MHGTNKITTEFASQMMHMHFNGITGDLFVPGIQFLFNQFARQYPISVTSVIPAGQILLVSVLRFASQRGDTFAGVEHDVTVAQLVAGLAVGSAHQSFQPGGDFYQRKRFTQIIVSSPDAALLHVPPAHRARSGSVPAHADLFSPFAQNIATIHAW